MIFLDLEQTVFGTALSKASLVMQAALFAR